MNDQWQRLEKLIGREQLLLLREKKVLVVGLGGVGGYVVEGLIRSGVSHLTLVDHDIVELTNLNRQIIALHSTLGNDKAKALKERCLDINPDAIIDSKVLFLDEKSIDDVFSISYDYVIDACDTITTKKLLIEKCFLEDIPIISCMGTARKKDPQKLEIIDIRKTSYDTLAKVIRKYVRDEFPEKKLFVLSSSEVPCEVGDGTLASSIFVPAIAGLLIANFVISELINKKEFPL